MVTSRDQTITGKKIFHDSEVPNPTENADAVSKNYVDGNFLNKLTGGAIGGDLDMRGNRIRSLKFHEDPSAAARVAELKLKFNKHGGTLQGPINMK